MLYVKKILLLFQLEFTSRTGLIFVFYLLNPARSMRSSVRSRIRSTASGYLVPIQITIAVCRVSVENESWESSDEERFLENLNIDSEPEDDDSWDNSA